MQRDFCVSAMKSRENTLLSAANVVATMDAEDLNCDPEELGGAYLGMWFLKRKERMKASARRSRMLEA
jgi:hypothetical protein